MSHIYEFITACTVSIQYCDDVTISMQRIHGVRFVSINPVLECVFGGCAGGGIKKKRKNNNYSY